MPHFQLVEGGLCRKGLHVIKEDNVRVRKDGARLCIECVRHSDRERSVRDRDKRTAANRERWSSMPHARKRDLTLVRRGITLAAYEEMFQAQAGRCAICTTDEPGGKWKTSFAVDHDHVSGAVRGLLCGHCNLMLGNAKDDPERLRAAAAYLEDRS